MQVKCIHICWLIGSIIIVAGGAAVLRYLNENMQPSDKTKTIIKTLSKTRYSGAQGCPYW